MGRTIRPEREVRCGIQLREFLVADRIPRRFTSFRRSRQAANLVQSAVCPEPSAGSPGAGPGSLRKAASGRSPLAPFHSDTPRGNAASFTEYASRSVIGYYLLLWRSSFTTRGPIDLVVVAAVFRGRLRTRRASPPAHGREFPRKTVDAVRNPRSSTTNRALKRIVVSRPRTVGSSGAAAIPMCGGSRPYEGRRRPPPWHFSWQPRRQIRRTDDAHRPPCQIRRVWNPPMCMAERSGHAGTCGCARFTQRRRAVDARRHWDRARSWWSLASPERPDH